MCAGAELDAQFAALCRPVSGGRPAGLGLALAALDEAYWSALALQLRCAIGDDRGRVGRSWLRPLYGSTKERSIT